MNPMTLIRDLGDNADLLTHSDPWLDSQYRAVAQEMDRLAQELSSLKLARQIKKQLQQRNIVAVQHLVKDANGEIIDVVINLMGLPDALKSLEHAHDTADYANRQAQ